jgi:cellulose synthase (UDP-forming)
MNKIQNTGVLKWWDYPIFFVLTALNTLFILWFLRQWFAIKVWGGFSVWLIVATILVFRNLVLYQMRWFSLLLMRKPVPKKAMPGQRVAAITTFVPGAESLEMLEETVRAMVVMDYAHDTWVLDEGDDERVKSLCARFGAKHFTRKHMAGYQTPAGTYQVRSKHGNYNAFFAEVGFDSYDVVVGFDPDHVPQRQFLTNILGYFDDPEVGYVQTPQVYYNQDASFIARGAAEESYTYYSVTQMAYNGIGQPVVTGCHHAHRVKALREVGGFAAHDADDLLITLLYRAAGWRGVYDPRVAAKGLTPVDWGGYLRQQVRWARSVLDVKIRLYPRLAGKLTLVDRAVALVHGLCFLQGATMLYVMLLLVSMLATGRVPAFVDTETLGHVLVVTLALLATELYKQRFFLDWSAEWGLPWRSRVLQFAKWPFLMVAFLEAALGTFRPYSITPKVSDGKRRLVLAWPHMAIAFCLVLAWMVGVAAGQHVPILVQLLAGGLVAATAALVWTEFWRYPEPYDQKLLKARYASGDQVQAAAWPQA